MPKRKRLIPGAKPRGSVLLLTIIAVLVLSVLVTGLLNVGTTEIYTTQNYQEHKSAYYLAVQGVEEIRTRVYNSPDALAVQSIVEMPPSEAFSSSSRNLNYYITGSLLDHENIMKGTDTDGVQIGKFEGFKPPPLPAISLGSSSSIEPVVWRVQVTSHIKVGRRSSFSEIMSGVYSVLTVGY